VLEGKSLKKKFQKKEKRKNRSRKKLYREVYKDPVTLRTASIWVKKPNSQSGEEGGTALQRKRSWNEIMDSRREKPKITGGNRDQKARGERGYAIAGVTDEEKE